MTRVINESSTILEALDDATNRCDVKKRWLGMENTLEHCIECICSNSQARKVVHNVLDNLADGLLWWLVNLWLISP